MSVQSEYFTQERQFKQGKELTSRELDYLASARISLFSVEDIPAGVHILEQTINSLYERKQEETHNTLLKLYNLVCKEYKQPAQIKPYKTRIREAQEARVSIKT